MDEARRKKTMSVSQAGSE